MSIDPFHPDDAGDYSAIYEGRAPRARRNLGPRIAVTVGALVLLVAAAVVAVAVV